MDNAKENLGKGCTEGSSQKDPSRKSRNDQVTIVSNLGNRKQWPMERLAHMSLLHYSLYIELTKDRESIFLAIEGRVPFRRLPFIWRDHEKRDPNKYYWAWEQWLYSIEGWDRGVDQAWPSRQVFKARSLQRARMRWLWINAWATWLRAW